MTLEDNIQLPENFEFNGTYFRWGNKDAFWAIGNKWEFKKNEYKFISYGNWRENSKFIWKSYASENSAHFQRQEATIREDIQKKFQAEAELKHAECARKWQPRWKMMPEKSSVHPYLKNKSITDNFSARTESGTLYIDAMNVEGFTGLQMIFPTTDPTTDNKYIKRFTTGIRKKGSFHCLPSKQAVLSSEVVYITEGFATACSVYMATNIPVVVSFDSGNMLPALRSLREIHSECKIIIAADDDKNKVGQKAAQLCKKSNNNVAVRYPKFKFKDDSQTDFNDLHQAEGLEAVSAQLSYTEDEFIEVRSLGYMDGTYFYSSSINGQIVELSPGQHTDHYLYQLAPKDYWDRKFGFNDHTGKLKIDWSAVSSELKKQCHARGMFNPENIRGRGVWKDGINFVINDGQELYGVPEKTQYHYQKLVPVEYKTDNAITDSEIHQLLNGFRLINFKNPNDYINLAGWYIQAHIFACLPWRFHLWLTGAKGNGKSTVLSWINDALPFAVYTTSATAAGIRQALKNDAFPTIFDESESSEAVRQNIELARQMSTNSGARVFRGTSSGNGITSNTQTIFLFGSIQVEELSSADASRIFISEIMPSKGQSPENYALMQESFMNLIQNKARIFARVYKSLPSIIRSREVIRGCLMSQGVEARMADQLSSMAACFWVFISTEAITTDQAMDLIEKFELIDNEYQEANEINDAEACMHDLLTTPLDNKNRTLSFCIAVLMGRSPIVPPGLPPGIHEQNHPDEIQQLLAVHGIRLMEDNKTLFLAANCAELKKKMTRFKDYLRILRRDPTYFVCNSKQRIKGYSTGSVKGSFVRLPAES